MTPQKILGAPLRLSQDASAQHVITLGGESSQARRRRRLRCLWGAKKKGPPQRDRQTHFLGPIGVSSLPREQSGYRASCSILNPLQGCSPRSGGRLLGISIGSYFAIVKELLNAFEQSCAEGRIVGAQHSSSAGGDLFLPRSRRNNNESMMRYACTM